MTCLNSPVAIAESNDEEPERTREYGECPECGGRATSAGETPSKAFMECGYCGNSFTESK